MTRGLRLLKRALARTKLSPEVFVERYPDAVNYYGARSIRRWLAGVLIPAPVVDRLKGFDRRCLPIEATR